MGFFSYQAKDKSGNLIQDRVFADSQRTALEDLSKRGLYVISLVSSEDKGGFRATRKRIKSKDIAQFTARLSDLISSGLPLLKSLELLAVQFQKKSIGDIILQATASIRDGMSFSDSLKNYEDIPRVLTALIESGEASGNLDRVLQEAAVIFQKELDLKNKVRSAMFYPIFVMAMGIGTVFFLLSFVIPKISELFQDLGQSLPLITQVVVSVSNIFSKSWWLIIAAAGWGYFGFKKYVKSGDLQLKWDRLKFKFPVMGKIWSQRELVYFSRSMGLLIKSGVSLVKAVDLTSSIVSSSIYKVEMEELKSKLQEGTSLSKGISRFLPQDAVDIISVGEETGSLETALLKVAQNYENDLDYTLKVATQLLEPVLILFVGSVVGIIVISVMLPIFQLNTIIK